MHHGITIRPEEVADLEGIRAVNESAFGRPGEGALVDALREKGILAVSLVAVADGEVVGHIAFSPVTLDRQPENGGAVALGPMAVTPEHQRQWIGTRLIEAGLGACQEQGFDLAVVLGHPDFYPRTGFVPSARYGITCEWKVPPEVFMIQALREGVLAKYGGVVHYHPAFNEVT